MEGAKEKMDLAHAEIINDGGTTDERIAAKMETERHVVRGSVAVAGGNRKVIIQPSGVCLQQMEGLKIKKFRVP